MRQRLTGQHWRLRHCQNCSHGRMWNRTQLPEGKNNDTSESNQSAMANIKSNGIRLTCDFNNLERRARLERTKVLHVTEFPVNFSEGATWNCLVVKLELFDLFWIIVIRLDFGEEVSESNRNQADRLPSIWILCRGLQNSVRRFGDGGGRVTLTAKDGRSRETLFLAV